MARPDVPIGNHVASLIEAAAEVGGQPDLGTVLRSTVETARQLTGARYGALGVVGPNGQLTDFVFSGVDKGTANAIGHLPKGLGVLGMITEHNQTILLDNIADHPAAVGFPPHHPPMHTFLGVPVRTGDEVFGNLYLADKEGGFSESDVAAVESLAVIAGSAVSRARLNERLRRLALIEDRERIAREIHDGVIQDLFAVGLMLKAASRADGESQSGKTIAEAVDRIDEAMSTLRRYILDLRPLPRPRRLDEQLVRLAENGSNESVSITVTTEGVMSTVPPHVVDEAVQFVREALSNAIRHSGAEVIRIVATRVRDRLILEVIDEGIGFDPDAVRGGMGLGNMRQRIRDAGGDFTVISAPRGGTITRAEMPIEI